MPKISKIMLCSTMFSSITAMGGTPKPLPTRAMPTQYDAIAAKYGGMQYLPAASLEAPSFDATIGDITGLRCLDLASGLGRWSRYLLEKGAASVVGVDISPKMVEQATLDSQTSWPVAIRDKATFHVGDCTKPLSIPKSNKNNITNTGGSQGKNDDDDGLYDIVFGAWLLNYAASSAELRAMWLNIASHLRPRTGRFIGIAPNVFASPGTHPIDPRYGVSVRVINEVADGYRCLLTADTHPEEISFEVYHLGAKVYQETAREAGLVDLDWKGHVLPPGDGREEQFWDAFERRPSFKIVAARRPGGSRRRWSFYLPDEYESRFD
jgi:SAM-dependent methyltransferase